eukprot:TRINITY_DN26815_c0_g3_i1.p1 TRINITY_DN26815_c0_g3~~TRINITY_DN26815_c0_g3_i1.p1  ORF type:complete len:533 (-),score=72.96 TRINITY_DN26815_c0_g3_i1:642-2240(-)
MAPRQKRWDSSLKVDDRTRGTGHALQTFVDRDSEMPYVDNFVQLPHHGYNDYRAPPLNAGLGSHGIRPTAAPLYADRPRLPPPLGTWHRPAPTTPSPYPLATASSQAPGDAYSRPYSPPMVAQQAMPHMYGWRQQHGHWPWKPQEQTSDFPWPLPSVPLHYGRDCTDASLTAVAQGRSAAEVLNLLAPAAPTSAQGPTSAAAAASSSPTAANAWTEAPGAASGGVGPSYIHIRNTFLHDTPDSLSHEPDREVRSCPPSGPPSSRRDIATPSTLDMEAPWMISTPTGSVASIVTPTGEPVLFKHQDMLGGRTLSDFNPHMRSDPDLLPSVHPDPFTRMQLEARRRAERPAVLPPAASGKASTSSAPSRRPPQAIETSPQPAQALLRTTPLPHSSSADDASTMTPDSSADAPLTLGTTAVAAQSTAAVSSPSHPRQTDDAGKDVILATTAIGADMDDPALGTQQLPSRGSALHQWGTCKPCAFVFKGGCANGTECQFCHLCEEGEKKRRKKDRLAARREAREEARNWRRLSKEA